MKINLRLLLITFTVIVIISLSSTFIYYSTTTALLKKQYSKNLQNSSNDFAFEFQNGIRIIEDDFDKIKKSLSDFDSLAIDTTLLDFVFTLDKNNLIDQNNFVHSKKIQSPALLYSIKDFIDVYPNIILLYTKDNNSQKIFYGKLISADYLEKISLKIRAEIAFITNNLPNEITNPESNEKYLGNLLNTINEYKSQNRTNVYYEELKSVDFFAVTHKPKTFSAADDPSFFIIFNTPSELSEFRDTIQMIILTFALAGVFLSLIFILLFTTKLRHQISLLSKTTKLIAEGNLSERVPIVTKDELGQLGTAFNDMLERIESKEKIEQRYLEIITIINENPSIDELSNQILEKIIRVTETTFGAFYLVNENELNLISTYGISEKTLQAAVEPDLYSNVINKKENIEIIFEEDFPSIKTGLLEIDIKYLLVIPIVFDKKVISVIEIASEHIPTINPKEYLDSIKEQLAIGINNAASLKQLKDLVDELKILNDQYQKQNEKIVDQNEELKKLHTDLKEKANELEEQRRKAVELTHVKSQFLANMSHELRTPLNSIIGLTELISDDSTTFPKTKDRLNIVLRNGKKLLTLINNILEFSKIESGKYEITKSDFIISEFINDIYLAMEPLVVEKDLQLSIVFANDKDLLIHSDKHKLEQIILNLISNAIKFTEVGGIKINIDETNDKSLKIDVVDTGIGISDEDKRLIFEEFKQVEHSDTKKFQGAGLGLTICKKYISLLDGKILVQSNDFKGSTFTILLSNVIIDSLPLLEKFRYQQNSSSKQINRKKLLLIHNDNRNKIIIENYFEKSEYDVIQSKPNIEIVEQIGDVSLDGILINATNITKDYWDMLYELKSNQSTTNIPIGVMSFQSDGKKAYLLDVFDIVVGEENINKINYCIDIIKLNNNKAEKILWLGDDSEARKGTIDQLNGHIDTMTVSEVENISDTIDEFKPDILIVDMLIENDTNLKLLTYLHQTNKFPIITVIPDSLNELDKQKLITALDTMVLDFSKRIEDVFRTLDRKYSLVKKLKKSISFPLENRKFEDDTEASTSSGISQNENQFHILVVDDDKDTQFTVGEIIKNIGCSISFANNGAECLTMLKSTAPDLILLDIRMPVMDGFEAIKRIRSNKETEHMLVYAMTAQAMLDDFGIIKQNGFDDLITKPIDNSTLSFKIQQRIQKILK